MAGYGSRRSSGSGSPGGRHPRARLPPVGDRLVRLPIPARDALDPRRRRAGRAGRSCRQPVATVRADARAFLRAAVTRLQEGVLDAASGRRRARVNDADRAAWEAATDVDGAPWTGPASIPATWSRRSGGSCRMTRSSTTDAGNFGLWVARHFRFRRPGTFLGPTSGAMGYGLPAAIAAASSIATGRSSRSPATAASAMTMAELETAVRRRRRSSRSSSTTSATGRSGCTRTGASRDRRQRESPPTSARSTSRRSPGPRCAGDPRRERRRVRAGASPGDRRTTGRRSSRSPSIAAGSTRTSRSAARARSDGPGGADVPSTPAELWSTADPTAALTAPSLERRASSTARRAPTRWSRPPIATTATIPRLRRRDDRLDRVTSAVQIG